MAVASKSFLVPGITCGHCVAAIRRELGEIPGVISVEGDEQTKRVTLEWEEGLVDWKDLRQVLEEIQYPPLE